MKRNWRKKTHVKLTTSKVFYSAIWNELRYLINCFLVKFLFFCSFIYVKHEQRYKCVTVSLATGLQNNFVNHGNFMSLNEICIRRQFFPNDISSYSVCYNKKTGLCLSHENAASREVIPSWKRRKQWALEVKGAWKCFKIPICLSQVEQWKQPQKTNDVGSFIL